MSRCPHGLPLFGLTGNTNRQARLEAMYILRAAIRLELTPRQRTCLLMYYENGFTMQEIAEQLGLNRSTVCRHIGKAMQRLQKSTEYMPSLNRTKHSALATDNRV